MIRKLKEKAEKVGAKRIVFAYEASGLGFNLYDELTEAGLEFHVLAPTKAQQFRKWRDERPKRAYHQTRLKPYAACTQLHFFN